MNITALENISYGSHERHVLDLYIPQKPAAQSGLILFIHGGGWTSCDKTAHTKDCIYRSEQGYICATMNYRYVDEKVTVYDELDDVAAALAKIRTVCKGYGFDLKKVLLSGGSAGAHLALMYAYTRAGASPLKPAAVFCHCPPTDCGKEDFLLGISGEFEDWKYGVLSFCCGKKVTKKTLKNGDVQAALARMSPITYITPDVVPTGICHGAKDELVPYEHTLHFLEVLKKNGIRFDLLTYPESGHAMDKDADTDIKAKDLMTGYLRDHLTD